MEENKKSNTTCLEEKIAVLQGIIDKSQNIVFFGGAGVSTESGIPDFRSTDGLYNQKWKYPPETILSRTFFDENPKEFYRFYREKLIIKGIKPNITHKKLAMLENRGKLKAIVTQNIDGLHQKAGSKTVYELHGSTLRNFCMNCKTFYDENFILESATDENSLPICTKCGGLVKPDVVLYEEGLDNQVVEKAIEAIGAADLLIIGGTSLAVYPAASFINFFKGKNLVIINKTQIPADSHADLVLHTSLGGVFEKIKVN
ncbi:NAD-dependent protein deacylase [Treponema pectinovorum]|uniref:NAD-dependent protein deacylase n=1 Tax=Treponema pectinovorum TaxID=164 RepID=UPI0011CC49CF|nr:NAD-dependent protein deacylase [Treponema pectinovorum]